MKSGVREVSEEVLRTLELMEQDEEIERVARVIANDVLVLLRHAEDAAAFALFGGLPAPLAVVVGYHVRRSGQAELARQLIRLRGER